MPERRAARSSAVSMCGSGMRASRMMRKARAKMAIAMIMAGAASFTLAVCTEPPMR